MRMPHRATTAVAVLVLAGVTAPGTALAGPAGGRAADKDDAVLTKLHQGGMAEVAGGRDARRHAVARCVKDAGRVLVRDHTRMDEQVRKVASRLRVSLPTTTTAEQRKQLKDLRAKARTADYDRLWVKTYGTAHVKTLALLDDEIAHGKNNDVRELARKLRPVVQSHLKMLFQCGAGGHGGRKDQGDQQGGDNGREHGQGNGQGQGRDTGRDNGRDQGRDRTHASSRDHGRTHDRHHRDRHDGHHRD
ncbi:hypothetical protein BLA24_11610 [Streptomyces cinnamoneus]|uniref:DUF4142 domain-containing protein n=1 Tax=Streptomyces cinnamoneus TaxID=53446 RepID=A0A2G1XKQ9_STRCJ|nr:DUF4142 domain-containing protein [Streptomyces cinnamoneus]PHQ51729.1 hypothetical protein BLA24_11610 [Streptomyces cinnamoneus]PPT11977.1 DUF4142 domain-containing protein [Streptomyces cinnamoneus]